MRPTLKEFALTLADAAATRSEDPKHQVGAAVLAHDGRVLGIGYNGPPPGVDLTDDQWADRDLVRSLIVHAETNALVGVDPHEAVLMATTRGPCSRCIGMAARVGVQSIVSRTAIPAKHVAYSLHAIKMFRMNFEVITAKMEVPKYGLPIDSLDRFQMSTRRTSGPPVGEGTLNWESRMLNWLIGLSGETGEVAELFKKHIYHGIKLDRDDLTSELGDVLWYLSRVADEADISMSSIAGANVKKLALRYPAGFKPGGGTDDR